MAKPPGMREIHLPRAWPADAIFYVLIRGDRVWLDLVKLCEGSFAEREGATIACEHCDQDLAALAHIEGETFPYLRVHCPCGASYYIRRSGAYRG